jgi:aminoglycoside phosphotransferase (APT) family kinase protein
MTLASVSYIEFAVALGGACVSGRRALLRALPARIGDGIAAADAITAARGAGSKLVGDAHMDNAAQIADRLAKYLGTSVILCKVLASGWETTVFEFALDSSAGQTRLPARQPLALRFYQAKDGANKGAREFDIMTALTGTRCVVPRPYCFERDPEPLGAPFLIMDRVAGGPLLQTHSFARAFKTISLALFAFVRTQVELHRLDVKSRGLDRIAPAFAPAGERPDAPLLNRMLRTIAARVEDGPLPQLKPALDWAVARARDFTPGAISFLHLDYHPLNTIVKGARLTGVIDWVFADLGDRHLDAAMTAMIMSSYAFERPRWLAANISGNTLRKIFSTLYVALYHSMAPLDFQRFRYCQAVAALHRLSMFGIMRRCGAELEGFRPEAAIDVTPAALRLLTRYAARKTGVAIALDQPSLSAA